MTPPPAWCPLTYRVAGYPLLRVLRDDFDARETIDVLQLALDLALNSTPRTALLSPEERRVRSATPKRQEMHMKLLATIDVPREARRRNWEPQTPRLTLRARSSGVEVVIDTAGATWTRTVTVASAAELLDVLAADVDRLAESIWGGVCDGKREDWTSSSPEPRPVRLSTAYLGDTAAPLCGVCPPASRTSTS